MTRVVFGLVAAGVLWVLPPGVLAQQVAVGTPLVGVHDGFFEHFNIGWAFRSGSLSFQFGGPQFAVPPFGGFNPSLGAHFGLANRWGNGEFALNFLGSQGRQTTMTMTAPSVTALNGVPGYVQDVSMRPFVVGLVPVVGEFPAFPLYPIDPFYPVPRPVRVSPLYEKFARLKREMPRRPDADRTAGADRILGDEAAPSALPGLVRRSASTAERGDISVAEIQKQQELEDAERQREIDRLIAAAHEAERSGRMGIARVRFQQAAARSAGQQREELLRLAAGLPDK
jgi:hypothetical protein